MSKLKTLRLIGYSKSLVIRPYEILVLTLNVTILVMSLGVMFVVRTKYLELINKIYTPSEILFPIYTVLIGCAIFVLLSLFNILVIRTKVK